MKKKKLCKFSLWNTQYKLVESRRKRKEEKKPDTQVYLQWGCRREYIKKYNKKAKEKDQKKVCVFEKKENP